MNTITPEERAIFDEISEVGAALWKRTLKVQAGKTDPKFFSAMLYRRLWGHHRSYALLWNNDFGVEGDIVLRAGLETAICIAANFRLRDGFVLLMRQDAAATVQRQIKVHRDANETDMVRNAEEWLRKLQASLPADAKPAKLDWKALAGHGGVSQLYGFHRIMSGISAHVTGLSLLQGDGFQPTDDQAKLNALSRKMHLMMMAAATLQGVTFHAGMIDATEQAEAALTISYRMDAASLTWPGLQP